MKIRSALVATIVLLSCTSIYAQSSKDFESKYEKSGEYYSVSKNLFMIPSYDGQGQVCLMHVLPTDFVNKTQKPPVNLDFEESLKFINELFPVPTRGRRGDGFGMSTLGGGTVWTEFKYEHVKFVFINFFRLTRIPEETLHMDFEVNEKGLEEHLRREAMTPDDQMMRERASSAKELHIVWVNRKCVKP